MKYLILLALISLSISDSLDELSIKVKQNLARQVKDLPQNMNTLIKNIVGYTNAYKQKLMYNQISNFFSGQGFPNKVYQKCLESTFDKITLYDGPDFLLGNNNQYSLNYYIASCENIDGKFANVIAVKGRYSGTLQHLVKLRFCHPRIKILCKEFVKKRQMNGHDYSQVRDILKTKYIQDALDKLNRV